MWTVPRVFGAILSVALLCQMKPPPEDTTISDQLVTDLQFMRTLI